MEYPRRPIPRMIRVRQYMPDDSIPNIHEHVMQQFRESRLLKKINGKRVAITAGDRGMGGYKEITRGIIDAVREAGGNPFLFNAVGSHGAATVDGQRKIFDIYGYTEKEFGVPVEVTMETVVLGTAENGAEAHFNKAAYDADATIVMSQVQVHPVIAEGIASGLMKMTTIGCGSQAGAAWAHSYGLPESVKAVPKVVLPKSNIVAGVAVVETGLDHPHTIEVVPPEKFEERDKELLILQKSLMRTIPFDHLHVLVVDFIGKNITGSGMDPNVIGFWRIKGGAHTPDFRRIVALDLTPESIGNGIGIGLADFTTEKFMKKFDWKSCYINLLTGRDPEGRLIEGQLPLALKDDREAIEVALYSAMPEESKEEPRLVRISSTKKLDMMYISEALIAEARQDPSATILDEPHEMPFDDAGNAIWRE